MTNCTVEKSFSLLCAGNTNFARFSVNKFNVTRHTLERIELQSKLFHEKKKKLKLINAIDVFIAVYAFYNMRAQHQHSLLCTVCASVRLANQTSCAMCVQ